MIVRRELGFKMLDWYNVRREILSTLIGDKGKNTHIYYVVQQ